MNQHTGASYDDIAEAYADTQNTKPWNIYFERPSVLNCLPELKGKDVLDAGCGSDFYAQFIAEQGAQVTAFDLNPVFVKRTQARGGRIKVFQVDLAAPGSRLSGPGCECAVQYGRRDQNTLDCP